MRIAICDDDKCIVEKLQKKVKELLDKWNIVNEIFVFHTGIDMLIDIDVNGIYDIIFLDIKLGEENGIDIAKKLRKENYIFSLVIISQYQSYYRDVFEVDAKWFLDKPFDDERLSKALRKIVKDIMSLEDIFEFSFKKSIYRLAVRDVVYVESNRRKLLIHCTDKNVYEYYAKLSELEVVINKGNIRFVRISQSYLINSLYIKRYSYEEIELHSGEKMMISQNRRESIKRIYINEMIENFS